MSTSPYTSYLGVGEVLLNSESNWPKLALVASYETPGVLMLSRPGFLGVRAEARRGYSTPSRRGLA